MPAKSVDAKGRAMVACQQCVSDGKQPKYFHVLEAHLRAHSLTLSQYQAKYPGAPVLSDAGIAMITPPESPEVLAFGCAKIVVRSGLDSAEQALVPDHDGEYELDDDKLELAVLAISEGDNVLAVGPTGSGKSTFFMELAALVNQPIIRVNLHGDVRASDFVGEKVVDIDPATSQAVVVWRDGVLLQAMRRGYWLLLDELDAAPPQILFVIQAVLEFGKKLLLTANGGEVVKADPGFRVIATANTLGLGDETGLYTGTNKLNEAFLDRFTTVLEWGYLGAIRETDLLRAKSGISIDCAKKMVECANLVRQGLKDEACYCTFSTRRLLAWARKTVLLTASGRGHSGSVAGHWRAANITIFNKLADDDRKFVEGVVQRVMGKIT